MVKPYIIKDKFKGEKEATQIKYLGSITRTAWVVWVTLDILSNSWFLEIVFCHALLSSIVANDLSNSCDNN